MNTQNSFGLIKPAIYFIFLILFLSNAGYAQESVGFQDHTDISTIEQYRLPDWGYSVIRMHLQSSGNFTGTEREGATSRRRSANIDLRPEYNYFHESEERILAFDIEGILSGFYQRRKDDEDYPSQSNRVTTSRERGISSSGDYVNYFNNNRFYYIRGNLNYLHARGKQEDIDLRIDRSTNENVTLSLRAGLGTGRIRNVTPVIRALRFRERALAIGRGDAIDAGHIQELAQHISQQFGYNRVYMRPARHFWGDLFSIVEPVVGDLSAYEMFYLADIFQESTGIRREGWDARIGMMYTIQYNFNGTETVNLITSRGSSSLFRIATQHIGPHLSASYFKNLTLRHQIGIDANGSYGLFYQKMSSDDTIQDDQLLVEINPSWLWTVTDRLLLQATLRNELRVIWYDEARQMINNRITHRSHHLWFTAEYFIEDRIVLSGNISYLFHDRFITDLDSSFSGIGYGIGLTYYFQSRM